MAAALDQIDSVVIVMLENRSFDHMLGYLNLPGRGRIALEGMQADAAWLARHANSGIAPHPITAQTIDDPPHESATIALQIGQAAAPGGPLPMNGFVASYQKRDPPPADPRLVMGYYSAASVPIFDFFARRYLTCDHWFAPLPTGTQANRLMAMSGATSLIDNAPLFLPDQPLVYDWLIAHKVSWCAYQSGDFLPFFALMRAWQDEIAVSLAADILAPDAHPRFRRFSNFARDWASLPTMPSVIFIEPEYTDGPHLDANDDHPPSGVAKGQAFLAAIYRALIANPARWARTLMIVTYDEHGGFYDHVSPLPIPTSVPGHGSRPVFATTGVRVPAFLVSPLVAPGSVYRGPLDHTSLLQLLADKFGGGLYSAAVRDRQPALSPLRDALQPAAAPAPPPLPPLPAADPPGAPAAAPAVAQATAPRAPGASANAAAFRLAAAKIVEDHAGSAAGWPALAAAVKSDF